MWPGHQVSLSSCGGRFMQLVVLHGYRGADTDAEQLALTEQSFDAALVSLVLLLGVSLACW